MSISSEITRLSGNVSAALTAIGAKGVTIPSGAKSDDLATLIAQIEGGGSVTWETKSDQGITIVADNPNYFVWTYTEALGANETYRITWGENGTQYICETKVALIGSIQDGYYLGNASIANSAYEDTGEPFMLYRDSATRMVGITNRTAGSWHIKIEKQVTSSATLVTKTITANGTYSASDDSADGYSEVTVNVPSSAASSWTKVAETSYYASTTSTSAETVATWATGHSEIWTSDKILYIRVRDTAGKRKGYFYGVDAWFINMYLKNSGTTTNTSTGLLIHNWSVTSTNGEYTYRYGYGTTGYGVYPDMIYSDGRIRIRKKYNQTYAPTVNGDYKVEVYLLDPAGGVPIFE